MSRALNAILGRPHQEVYRTEGMIISLHKGYRAAWFWRCSCGAAVLARSSRLRDLAVRAHLAFCQRRKPARSAAEDAIAAAARERS